MPEGSSKKRTAPDEQAKRFIEAARELGCDESEERFVETVRKIAKAPPQHRAAKKPVQRATKAKR
jgi:hypothetical protein